MAEMLPIFRFELEEIFDRINRIDRMVFDLFILLFFQKMNL